MFRLFADLIARHIDVQERLARSEAALLDERQAVELREQFIAVLGHDLRNPLAAIQGASRLLMKTPLDEKAQTIIGHVQGSVGRMAGLIDNLMDFARARLGGGFEIVRRADPALDSVIAATVDEVRLAHPARTIVDDIEISDVVICDSARLAQLLSNLLGNAVTHGAEHSPVTVTARTTDGAFELSVTNLGEPIPAATQARLFQPFSRANYGPGKQGLGLGLYIATEIARAHGGTLSVASGAAGTCFTFRMPLAA
jgi:signal transduction histidine kinase